MSTRKWYLPIDDFNAFFSELENDVNYERFDIKIIDQPTIVYIESKGTKIHVRFFIIYR